MTVERKDGGGLHPALSGVDALRRRDIAIVTGAAAAVFFLLTLFEVIDWHWALPAAVTVAAAAWARAVLMPTSFALTGGVEPPAVAATSRGPEFPLTPEMGVAIIERLPDPLILLDRSGRLILHNRAAANIVGKAAARRHISTILRVPAVLDAVAQVLAGDSAQVVDYTQPVPIERHYHAFVAPIASPIGGQVGLGGSDPRRGVLILLHDLTTIKRAERMRADFIANASHELRTPLASLAGFVETLRGPARDDVEARDRFLNIMQEQAERMGRLINDLLSLSRIELNEHVRPDTPVDLGAIVADTIDMIHPLADAEGVEIALEVEPGLPMPLGARDELVQVFQNLLANAIKYGGSGGEIEVKVGRARAASARGESASASPASGPASPDGRAGSVYVSVRDKGPGIAREHLPRLTERFYRVDVETSRKRGGTGLGLAIVKHIVNRHLGSLGIESKLGEGSTFTVFLPVNPAASDTEAA